MLDRIDTELNEVSTLAIRKGSKSFSLASRFFGAKEREACHLLYHWCRYCDDAIDGSSSTAEARRAIRELYFETDEVERGRMPMRPAFRAFKRVSEEYRIPTLYARDLLKGFESDAEGIRIRNEADLETYCYRVAGVVGLMMCHIMGLDDGEARKNAVDLGIAMQMTNIARDVHEDFRNGRVYLPETWLYDAGIRSDMLFADSQALFSVVRRLLDEANQRYVSGHAGLHALPTRAAIAVSIAASVYAGIGEKLLRRGSRGLRRRTILTNFEKFYFAIRGLVRVTPLAVRRLFVRWRALPLEDSWQFKTQRS
jgi:15-cis-phytoene synthase